MSVSAAIADLRFLEKRFGTRADIAAMLEVDRSSVTRWLQNQGEPEVHNEERIAALRFLFLRLIKIFHPEVATAWLLGINAFLNNQRPIDLVAHGRVSEVLAAIEQTEAGSYA